MPHIFVSHARNFGRDFFDQLKAELRQRAAMTMSTPSISLNEGDFSFHFLPAGPNDDLIKDLEVIILAHDDEDGVRAEMEDRLAEMIGQGIAHVLERQGETWVRLKRPITFSVSVHLGKMSYFPSEVQCASSYIRW